MLKSKSLLEYLDKIEQNLEQNSKNNFQNLFLEAEKMYVYNAFGICLGKLTNFDDKKYKEGILRSKAYFEKIKQMSIQ